MVPQKPTLTRDQITGYFDRIKLPEKYRRYDIEGEKSDVALDYLTRLQQYHLVAVPFENLTLHYSYHRQITINVAELYKKIVEDNNGRGGYCMENNTLFGTLLRSLGFNLYSAGARVAEGNDWTGWSHMVNIVRIGDARYHVDVGFGGNGPTRPLKLESDTVSDQIHPATMRLQWRNIGANEDPDQRLWVYEHRADESSEFQQTYCFTELEFLANDFSIANYYTSTSPKTFFTQTVVCVRMLFGGDKDKEIVGQVILGDSVKWRIHGKKEREDQFKTEGDRIKALKEVFGIEFSSSEQEHIRGSVSAIKEQ